MAGAGFAAFFGNPERQPANPDPHDPRKSRSPGGPFEATAALRQPATAADMGAPGVAPAGQGGFSTLNTHAANVRNGTEYRYHSVYPPTVPEAVDPNLRYVPRNRYFVFGGAGTPAGTVLTQQMIFAAPTVIVGRTAAAYTTTNAALPVGRSSLDTFKGQWFSTGTFQDLFDAGAGGANGVNTSPLTRGLGSMLYGSAGLPALIPGHGKLYDPGYSLSVTVEILIADVEVHICAMCIEELGPTQVA